MFRSTQSLHSLSCLDERQLDDIGMVRQGGWITAFDGRPIAPVRRPLPAQSLLAAIWSSPSLQMVFRH